ncbi:MAG: hypothetical protein HeimC3_35310 [Candidatus Heimdallarchaeota archaeon LC_3]|nr:MAG: hypothetical protein HeimC3_35310 [Candidatus Heimdallarchaeota archaeon LC_3]
MNLIDLFSRILEKFDSIKVVKYSALFFEKFFNKKVFFAGFGLITG